MSESKFVDEFLEQHADIEVIEVLIPDINNRLRGKWIGLDKLHSLCNGRLKLPVSTLAFDVWGRDPAAWVFADGDGDGVIVPELSTFTRTPWCERPTAQVLASLSDAGRTPCPFDPRTLVRTLDQAFALLGLTPVPAIEMEFYLFRAASPQRPVHTQQTASGAVPNGGQTYGIDDMQDMAAVLDDIRRACETQQLPVDTLIKEAGVSQYEINLHHQRTGLLAADQALLLQRVIRGVARKHQLHASFMAKPLAADAGSGMHVHCSVIDEAGNNIFCDGSHTGSKVLHEAIGGTLSLLNDSMLLFAPHMNSYKRLQPGCHAPMTVSWGYDNRTVAVRVPNDDVQAVRIEHRVAGADASPHLVIAGLLAGLLDGIQHHCQPPPAVSGDAQEQQLDTLSDNWLDAIRVFEKSTAMKQALGEEFCKVFALTKRQEWQEFAARISQFEFDTYL